MLWRAAPTAMAMMTKQGGRAGSTTGVGAAGVVTGVSPVFLDCLRWPHKQTPYPPSSVCFQRAHPSTCATSKLSLRQGPWASPHSEGMDSGDGPAAVRRGRLGSIWLCGAEIQG